MARKKKLGWWQWFKQKLFGKKEFVQRVKTVTGKTAKNADEMGTIILEYAKIKAQQAKDEPQIDVPGVPTPEEILPGGTPQIQQPQFGELKPFDFSDTKAQAEKDFSQRDLPALAERFASMGKGVVSSPGFGATMARAQGDFRSKLAALEKKMGLDYGLQRGELETRQAGVGLQAQGAAADSELGAGRLRLQGSEQGLKRADLQSMLQQRKRFDPTGLSGYAMQKQFEPVIRSAEKGIYKQGEESFVNVLKALAKFK